MIARFLPTIICAIVSVILQIMLAPNIHILNAAPNFILAFTIAYSVANYQRAGYILPFVLGLAYDFLGTGPIGAMAAICTIAAAFAFLFMRTFDNETLFIPLIVVLAVTLASQVSYGLLMLAFGYDVGLLEVLIARILPCALYDIVIAIVIYLVASRTIYKSDVPAQMAFIGTSIK